MNKTTIVSALLALVLSTFTVAISGCKSDPHDTHIRTSVTAPR